MEQEKNNSVKKEKAEIEKSPLDKFDNQKYADQIPLEDLKIEAEQEKNKKKTQQSSQSERKLKTNKK